MIDLAVDCRRRKGAAPIWDDARPATDATGIPEAAQDVSPVEASDDVATPDATADATAIDDATADATADGPPAHCFDHRKDGDESDVDCGGSCAGCGPGKDCYATFDCSTTVAGCDSANGGCFCHYAMHVCVYDHCYDTVKDGDESDVDCGGTSCGPCQVGEMCGSSFDCQSGHLCSTSTHRRT